MRSVRLVASLLAAVALATCADSPTGPRAPRTAHLAFAPVFTARANAAAAELQAAGVTIASIRVLITRPGTSDVLVDRVIEVVPGESSVTLEVDVTIQGTEELLTAKLQYRDANGLVLYEGAQSITAKQGTNAATQIGNADVDYVGPGATATELLISPLDTAISTTTPFTLAVKAVEEGGAVVESPLVVWTSSDAALATVSATGLVTPVGPRGVVKITAKIPSGIGAEATVRLVPPPSQVGVFSGAGQSGLVRSVLPAPFKVQVKAADGVGSAGVPVTFESLTDGGSVDAAVVETDADGYARATMSLGSVAGEYQFRARAGTLEPVTISATALPLPAAALTIVARPTETARSGIAMTQPLRVQLVDSTGKPAAKEGVTVTVAAARVGEMIASLVLTGTTSVATGANGVAEFANLTLTGLAGDFELRVSAGTLGTVATPTMTLTNGEAAALAVKPQPPTAPIAITVGGAITEQLWLETTDGAGNRVPDVPVRFVVRAEAVTGPVVMDTTIRTNGIGELPATSFPTPLAAGHFHVVMTVGTPAVATAALELDVTPAVMPAPTMTKVSGDAQADTIDALLAATPLVVELRDAQGQPLANQQVVWRALPTITHTEGSYPNVMLIADPSLPESSQEWYVETLSTLTDAQGRAQMHVRLGSSTAHAASVRASTAAQDASTDFNLTVKAGAPDWIRIVQQPSTMRAGLPLVPELQAQLVDAYDNPSPVAGVMMVLDPYFDYGESLLMAGAQSSTTTDAGTPTRRTRVAPTRTTSGSTSGTLGASGSTTLASASKLSTSGGGTLQSISEEISAANDTAYTDASGKATFTGLTVGGQAGAYWLDVYAPSLEFGGYGDNTVTMLAGLAARLAVRTGDDAAEVTPGDTVTVEARLADAWDNPITPDETDRPVTWSTGAGVFAPAGAASATTTMQGGYAEVTFVAPTTLGAVTSITATTPGLSGEATTLTGTTPSMTVVQATPAAIVYGAATAVEAGDRQVRLVGETLASPLVVKVLDDQGRPIPGLSVIWRRWHALSYTDIDTTTTDSDGLTSILPVLSTDTTYLGYVFEATPQNAQYVTRRFQAAARPDPSWDRVWFGSLIETQTTTGDWSLASNWTNGVPTATSSVLLPDWSGYATQPRLSSDAAAMHVRGTGYGSDALDLRGLTLTVGGSINARSVIGTGTVRMTGSAATLQLLADSARLEIAQGASVTVAQYASVRSLDVFGTLTAAQGKWVGLTNGDLRVGAGAQLTLTGSASITSARSVVFEDGAGAVTGDGYISFTQGFEQRGTTPLVLNAAFMLMAMYDEPGARSITLASPGTRLGHVLVSGPAGGGSTLTFATPAHIQGQLQVTDAAVIADSLQVHGQVHALGAADFAQVRIIDSYGTSAPYFESGAAAKVNVNAEAGLYGPSKFRDLEIRARLGTGGNRLDVSGNLKVIGDVAGIASGWDKDSITVGGVAHFEGGSASDYYSQGTLILYGDFYQADAAQRSPGAFRPGPEFQVVFAGRAQNVTFQTPSHPTGTGSYFHRVRVEPEAIVTQQSTVFSTGLLEVLGGGSWAAVDYNEPEPARLLEVVDSTTAMLKVSGSMQLSRLNLRAGVKVDIQDPGSVSARSCYDEGANVLTQILPLCETTSQIPLIGSLLGVLGSSSPLTSVALVAAIEDRRRAGE